MAQFLCCIPLTTVDVVLSWLKPAVPAQEQEELLAQVSQALLHPRDSCPIVKTAVLLLAIQFPWPLCDSCAPSKQRLPVRLLSFPVLMLLVLRSFLP